MEYSLWASMMFGVATLPVMIWSAAVFDLLGQEPGTAVLAADYLRIAGWGILPALMVMVLKSYLAALERTKVVLRVTLAAVGLNVIVNYLLIFGRFGFPELGVRGAAMASLGVNCASLLVLGAYVHRSAPEHALFTRFWRPDGDALARVFRLGWPIGLTSLAEVGLFAASSVMMGWLGTVPLAAHGIALQITSLVFMVHLGLSNVATVRAGQAYGRGDAESLRAGARVVLALSALTALITMAAFLIWPDPMIGLFLAPDDPARAMVIATGRQLLAAAALFQLVDAAQVQAIGLLRGVQDTRAPMVIAAVSYWAVGVPVSYWLGFTLGYGGAGIWFGLAIGLALAGVLLLTRFWGWSARGVSFQSRS